MFLSSATLLVLPVNLVSHWQQQIQWHASSLRVAVLDGPSRGDLPVKGFDGESFVRIAASRNLHLSRFLAGSSDARTLTPQHLAWDFDLVITTFQHLSSGWKASDKLSSPLLQVMPGGGLLFVLVLNPEVD